MPLRDFVCWKLVLHFTSMNTTVQCSVYIHQPQLYLTLCFTNSILKCVTSLNGNIMWCCLSMTDVTVWFHHVTAAQWAVLSHGLPATHSGLKPPRSGWTDADCPPLDAPTIFGGHWWQSLPTVPAAPGARARDLPGRAVGAQHCCRGRRWVQSLMGSNSELCKDARQLCISPLALHHSVHLSMYVLHLVEQQGYGLGDWGIGLWFQVRKRDLFLPLLNVWCHLPTKSPVWMVTGALSPSWREGVKWLWHEVDHSPG
jgi:hypothetical protein